MRDRLNDLRVHDAVFRPTQFVGSSLDVRMFVSFGSGCTVGTGWSMRMATTRGERRRGSHAFDRVDILLRQQRRVGIVRQDEVASTDDQSDRL